MEIGEDLKNKANDLANNIIEQKVSEDYKPFVRQAVDTLGQIGQMKDRYKQLGELTKPQPGGMPSGSIPIKKRTGWQRFKQGIGKIWETIKNPAQKLISALPFGGQVNKVSDGMSGLIQHFKTKR
ncbi:Hypothetical_protein [Hexamita inflata]|uniref:Hypothetical_protein n=1 Tax=Hexamita inflata TaxID=28002 RepID=A0AA86P6J0_9EUKA|nr:Hypothetical protein HINF_LOCUS20263 [Hexamita inflata]